MEYKNILSNKTLSNLDKKSKEHLKQMLGDRSIVQTISSSNLLLSEIAEAEKPYIKELEKLALDIIYELYPILKSLGIKIDAQITSLSDTTNSLDEIKYNAPKIPVLESLSPESRRRLINAITQGAALRGAFAFHLFKEALDKINPSLVEKYNQIMKNSFGIYDDENAIALLLSLLAQGHKAAGGTSKVIINESKSSNITIKARAICFPMLIHEIIKGLYELISLQGFRGDKESNQKVVDKIDTLQNEPHDIKYGKFIYDTLNNLFASSQYNDPRIREFFFAEVYKLEDNDFISLIENSINEELTPKQKKWVDSTLKEISLDLRNDDYDETGLDEIRVKKPPVIWDINNKIVKTKDVNIGDKLKLIIRGDNDPHLVLYVSIIDKRILNNKSILVDEENKFWDDSHLFNWYKQYQKYLSHKNIYEIKFNPFNYKINPQTKLVQSKISTTYLGKNEIYALVDLGSYYTVVPYGNQNTAPLFPKQYFFSLEDTYSTSQILTPDEVEFLKNLLKSGKYFIHKESPKPLKEYNEKTIKNTIERWKQENPEVEENSARQLISRFDQIKSSLSQKLDIVSLSDELKKNNNYLNIDKYSYEDMMNLIKSLPENPDKVKKEAIKNFIEREEIDKNLAASYVARFMNKREELKYATENGTENGAFSKEEVINYIPKRLLKNKAFMDPRLWKFSDMESMLDAIFPSYRKVSNDEENIAETDADKIYDKNGIEIYKGDDINKCIRYNPTDSKSKTKYYGWCVAQPGNTNYDYYRFKDKSPTFYFVFDREKTSEKKSSGFVDPWHAFVLQVNKDNESYVITDANNRGDESVDSWSNIKRIVPPETWNKIKDLKEYFKSIPLSGVERGRKFASGKNLSLDEFKELNQEEKIQYIQGKASKNQISDEILKILPKYKISYEGRTTTLANVAIDSGQKFDYDSLKDHESLAKRYAIFRFRHTDYGEDPIPLPFIKFLDNEAKQKYFKRFEEDYLNYSLTKKFFGDEILIDIINKKSKEFEYIQPEYIKYISDNNIKKIYELYSKLTQNWSLISEKELSEDNLNKIKTMPEQTVSPVPITYEQWKSLSNSEKNLTVDLIEKLNNNPKYKTLLYALPYLILDKDTKYILLPEKADNYYYPEWILSEISGKIVKSSISGDLFLGENYLSSGFPDETSEGSINRIFKLSDLKKL